MKPDISIAWATKHINCTPEGKKICQGRCCKFKNGHGRYYPNELKKLPNGLQERLRYKDGQFFCTDNNGVCDFIDECLQHPEYRPDQCKIWPFVERKKKLIMINIPLNCPQYGKGEKTAFESCEKDLVDVYGRAWYNEKALQLK